MNYNSFTDIEFNPKKSINCQAMAAAVFVSLSKKGLLTKALEHPDTFVELVYGINKIDNEVNEQMRLFDSN